MQIALSTSFIHQMTAYHTLLGKIKCTGHVAVLGPAPKHALSFNILR
jgi:hypothetical protein